jgi:hypothetical protein
LSPLIAGGMQEAECHWLLDAAYGVVVDFLLEYYQSTRSSAAY